MPLDWVNALPRRYTHPGPMVPTLVVKQEEGVVYAKALKPPDVRLPTVMGLVRILTWDITAHLPWTQRTTSDFSVVAWPP